MVQYAPPLLNDNSKAAKTGEIAKLVGEAYYRQKKYKEAIPFLKQHLDKSQVKNRDQIYQLGHAHYLIGAYDDAVDIFEILTFDKDELSQLAQYEMADAYLKLDKKMHAVNAFYEVSKIYPKIVLDL